jgi:putative copper resistance protein D
MLVLLAATRFVHFVAAALLFGLLAFPVYAPVPGEAGRMAARTAARAVRALAVLALLTAVLALACAIANMTGEAASLLDPVGLWDILRTTGFGQTWGVRLGLGLLIVALAWRARPDDGLLTVLAALFLISIAYSGHSRMQQGALGWAHIFADALHLMAAGAWLGGLLALVLLVPRLERLGREGAAARVLHQFSGMGYFAVAALVLTGLFKSWLLVGRLSALTTTPYGWVLLVKLALFAGMGALALSNRLWITPALERRPADPALWLGRLKRQAAAELGLGVLVLAAVGLMGAMEPPVSM